MSDGDNSDFLDDPKAYEDEQSDVFSGLSRRGSESYNQPPEDLNIRRQDSGAKNPNMVVDLKTRLRKNTSESSEPMRTHQDIPVPPPPMYNPPIMNPLPPQQQQETGPGGKPVVEIGMRLKSIYPQRYFIFKNMKPQHFKFCKDNNYGITQKTNENTLKSAFEVRTCS